MHRFAKCVVTSGVLSLMIAGCGGSSSRGTPAPTGSGVTAAPSTRSPTLSPKLGIPSADAVESALVTAADITGSTADIAPTRGTNVALGNAGLQVVPCIQTSGIESGTRTSVGTDVTQPLSQSAGEEVTEIVLIESDSANLDTDIGQATAGARACKPEQNATTGPEQFGDRSVRTNVSTIGSWTGTCTGALDTYSTGVTEVANYAYFLTGGASLLLLELDISFAGVNVSARYQQESDQLATTLAVRLSALS